jgi:hypothetical protein
MRLPRAALAFARQLTAGERAELRRVLRIIQMDPSPDGVNKILLPLLPLVLTAYVSSPLWVVYRLEGNTIVVSKIGRAKEGPPRPW